jgi:hypothetical protein
LLPPLRFPARVFVKSVSPNLSMVSITTFSIVYCLTPSKCEMYVKVCLTVRPSSIGFVYGQKPTIPERFSGF